MPCAASLTLTHTESARMKRFPAQRRALPGAGSGLLLRIAALPVRVAGTVKALDVGAPALVAIAMGAVTGSAHNDWIPWHEWLGEDEGPDHR